MEDLEKMPALSAPAHNPQQWLAGYLHTRARLASLGSEFNCDPACSRPGCKNLDLQVQVSLVDLLAAARHRQEPVAALFRRHYSLGLFSEEREDWIRKVGLKVQKPCPFLEHDLCGIYPVRPLPCILFPEYLVAEDKFAATAAKEPFRGFLCLQRPFLLSPERAGIMAQLLKMWARETLITSFFLFDQGSCHLDFSNLTGELLEMATRLGKGAAPESPEPGRPIPHLVLERFFLEQMARHRPFAAMEEKIEALGNQEGEDKFLRLMQDDLLLHRLKQQGNDRALVFRLVKGRLRATRRSLLPPEYKFF